MAFLGLSLSHLLGPLNSKGRAQHRCAINSGVFSNGVAGQIRFLILLRIRFILSFPNGAAF